MRRLPTHANIYIVMQQFPQDLHTDHKSLMCLLTGHAKDGASQRAQADVLVQERIQTPGYWLRIQALTTAVHMHCFMANS